MSQAYSTPRTSRELLIFKLPKLVNEIKNVSGVTTIGFCEGPCCANRNSNERCGAWNPQIFATKRHLQMPLPKFNLTIFCMNLLLVKAEA